MKRAELLCLAGLALAGAGGRGAPAHVVERSFATRLKLEARSFRLTTDQDGVSSERDGVAFTREQSEELEIEDAYEDELEPPGRFTRLYRTVLGSLKVGGKGEPHEKEESAGLEGTRVTFERNARGSYDRATDKEGVKKAQLKDLRVALSLQRLLPPEDHEPGAEWTVSFDDLAWLLSPVIDPTRRPSRARPPPFEDRASLPPSLLLDPTWKLLEAAEGEVTASEDGPAEAGRHRATLRFRLASTHVGSLTDLLDERATVADEVRARWEGQGKLEWDDEGGASLELSGKLACEEEFTVSVERAEKSVSIHGELEATGELELEAKQLRRE